MATHAQPPGSGPSAAEGRPAGGPSSGPAAAAASAPADLLADRRPSVATRLSLGVSRQLWRDRAQSWAEDGSVGLRAVVDAVVAAATPVAAPGGVAVDLGCGSGQVTLELASRYDRVIAIDIDAGAIDLLATRAQGQGLENINGIVHPLETLELAPASVDLVVSNYAMHHLRDADKRSLLERSYVWLRPGGRLVIGDMMFGRGAASDDRAIIRRKVSDLIVRGPAGWWRILKNAGRFLLRFQEKPLRPAVWESLAAGAGFERVHVDHIAVEAHVLSATKPPGAQGQ